MDINPVWYFRKVLVKINRILIRVLNGALFFSFCSFNIDCCGKCDLQVRF